MWVCGLKHYLQNRGKRHHQVTPYVGVWIETLPANRKQNISGVTPYVGVWIETDLADFDRHIEKVTPYVGVWIETYGYVPIIGYDLSHPMWVCGLKPPFGGTVPNCLKSHPMWVCGLKQTSRDTTKA